MTGTGIAGEGKLDSGDDALSPRDLLDLSHKWYETAMKQYEIFMLFCVAFAGWIIASDVLLAGNNLQSRLFAAGYFVLLSLFFWIRINATLLRAQIFQDAAIERLRQCNAPMTDALAPPVASALSRIAIPFAAVCACLVLIFFKAPVVPGTA